MLAEARVMFEAGGSSCILAAGLGLLDWDGKAEPLVSPIRNSSLDLRWEPAGG